MATKKHIAKQLRALSREDNATVIEKDNVTRVQKINGKYYRSKKTYDMFSNPYRRLKRRYNRGEVKLNLLSRNECKSISYA